jgi:hypothetical protein
MTKEELVNNICNKLGVQFEDNFFDNQTNTENHNDTVSKDFFIALSEKCEIDYNGETKGELALLISDKLEINCEKGIGKDIGEADQIAKTCLEKIYNGIS